MLPQTKNKPEFRFHSGIEALPDAALILSTDLLILSGNKKAQRLLGVRFPDDVGKHIEQLLNDPLLSDYLAQDNFESPCLITSPINDELQLEISVMAFGGERVILMSNAIAKYHQIKNMKREIRATVSPEFKTTQRLIRVTDKRH